jgi:hypothetical protein
MMNVEKRDDNPGGLPAVPERPRYQALTSSKEEMAEMTEVIQSNLAGQSITERDFERVVLPPQGMLQWEIPTLEDRPEYSDHIEGIIIKVTHPRAYWEAELEESSGRTPPDCASPDGVQGYGRPGGDCQTCPFNKWGSGRNNSKACREQRMLYMLRPLGILPVLVQVPATSLESIKKHIIRLSSRGIPYWKVYTQIRLEKITTGAFPYSHMLPSVAGFVEEELIPNLKAYIDQINPLLAPAPYRFSDTGVIDPGQEYDAGDPDQDPGQEMNPASQSAAAGAGADQTPTAGAAADQLPTADAAADQPPNDTGSQEREIVTVSPQDVGDVGDIIRGPNPFEGDPIDGDTNPFGQG